MKDQDPFVLRLLNRLSSWFPVLLLASLAMLTYWLDAQVQSVGRGSGAAPQDPDYFLEDFAATSFGKDGSVIQQWDTSGDAGTTWNTVFRGIYRHPEAAAAAE